MTHFGKGLTYGAVFVGSCALASPAQAQLTQSALGAAVDAGTLPRVRSFDAATGPLRDFLAYAPTYTGGVRIALGDIDGDGAADLLVAPGLGGGSELRVFDGNTGTLIRNFFAFGPTFPGGVYVAAGDVDGDGRVDLIAGAGEGGTVVRVFSGRTLAEIRAFEPFGSGFMGGIRVASGDIDGDGYADIVVGSGAGGTPRVRVFDGRGGVQLRDFDAYAAGFTGGVYVAAGDVDGDGRADVITGADSGGAPHVKVFSGRDNAEIRSFFAYAPTFTGGVRVAAGDIDGDGDADVITGPGPGAAPQVNLYVGSSPTSFFAFDPGFTGGIYVAGPVTTDKLLRDGFE